MPMRCGSKGSGPGHQRTDPCLLADLYWPLRRQITALVRRVRQRPQRTGQPFPPADCPLPETALPPRAKHRSAAALAVKNRQIHRCLHYTNRYVEKSMRTELCHFIVRHQARFVDKLTGRHVENAVGCADRLDAVSYHYAGDR